MTAKQLVVSALLRAYPAPWRREYGPELGDLLLGGSLGPVTIANVVSSAARERIRSADAAARVGVVAMAAITAIIVWNIAAPQPHGTGWTALLVPSAKTLPTVLVAPLGADVYLLALGAFGCWWALSRGVGPARAGLAAMRVSFLAGVPIVIAGVLMMIGFLSLLVLTPGDVPGTYREHGFALTYYAARAEAPPALSIAMAPLFRLPEAWLWGAIGASIGRWLSRMHVRLDA